MARSSRQIGDKPYVVSVQYTWRDQPTCVYPISYHHVLSVALDRVRAHQLAWLQLVGAQPTPLSWLVIDERDYTQIRPGIPNRFGETRGTDEKGRAYARWSGHSRVGPRTGRGHSQRDSS